VESDDIEGTLIKIETENKKNKLEYGEIHDEFLMMIKKERL
jgi:hypothetical protein